MKTNIRDKVRTYVASVIMPNKADTTTSVKEKTTHIKAESQKTMPKKKPTTAKEVIEAHIEACMNNGYEVEAIEQQDYTYKTRKGRTIPMVVVKFHNHTTKRDYTRKVRKKPIGYHQQDIWK